MVDAPGLASAARRLLRSTEAGTLVVPASRISRDGTTFVLTHEGRPLLPASDGVAAGAAASLTVESAGADAGRVVVEGMLRAATAAEAARYPSFRLSGSLGLSALTWGALTDSASVLRSLLGSVSAPLFDGGAARAQVRSQAAALEQARLAYQGTVITAVKDVEDALVALQGDRERLLRLQVEAGWWMPAALPLRWSAPEYAPQLAATGAWA